MMSAHTFTLWTDFNPDEVKLALGTDRSNKPQISMTHGPNCTDVAVVTPACVTNWPRVTGDGNFGTMWGPTDIMKAKFSLDLTDGAINGSPNADFEKLAATMEQIDDKLLDFVHNNQLKILGRKNLSREEVKMLQIRTVRPKYDKLTGALTGHSIQMTAAKYAYDGMGGKYARNITICDKVGAVVPHGSVAPGDVVAATMFANMVYTGVGGDKFGIHWSFEDVAVVCQRTKLEQKTSVPVFGHAHYACGREYESAMQVEPIAHVDQFSD